MREYGLSAIAQAPTAASDRSTDVAMATIDFGAQGLRGSVGLAMTPGVVIETYLRPSEMSSVRGPRKDWTGAASWSIN